MRMGIFSKLSDRFHAFERETLNWPAKTENLKAFLGKTEGNVYVSAVARPMGASGWKVNVELVARSNKPVLGRKWMLRHEHNQTDFESLSGANFHPSQDPKTLYEELQRPMLNANAMVPHMARRIEEAGRLTEQTVDQGWEKSFEQIQAELKKKRK